MAILFQTVVNVWNTKHPGKRMGVASGNIFMLNTNRIIELRAKSDTTSGFYYANDPDDRRDSPDYIEVTCTTDEIEVYHNTDPTHKLVDLDIYPGTDLTETPVTTTLEWKDIAYIYQTPRDVVDVVSHMVYYRKAWERVECIIDHIPDGIDGMIAA